MAAQKTTDILALFEELLAKGSAVNPDDIPGIDLYMDQVTTFMDAQLAGFKRHEKDKVLTKTMINNYTKNKVLPPPEKKKYSREHLLVLLFIYYLKDFLSFDDIQRILQPITDRFFRSKDEYDMTWLYREMLRLQSEHLTTVKQDLEAISSLAGSAYADAGETDEAALKDFALIGLLSYDVYIKKKLIEQLIDRREK